MNHAQLTAIQQSENTYPRSIQRPASAFQQLDSDRSIQNCPRSMSDSVLVSYTQRLAKQERELLTQVLHHLHEIDRRKLFSSFKYPSLFEFATKHLGYSEDQACRRVSAMRLMQHIPEVEGQLETGELNLSHISVLSAYFNQEAKLQGATLSVDRKREVINMVLGTSIRKAQQIMRAQSSNPTCLSTDQIKVITETHVELKFSAPREIIEQIEILKGLLAHKHPNITLGELFVKLAELGIAEWNPSKPVRTSKMTNTQLTQPPNDNASPSAHVKPNVSGNLDRNLKSIPVKRKLADIPTRDLKSTPANQSQDGTPVGVPSEIPNSQSRYILASVKCEVYKRAHNKCEKCSSTYALQIEHVLPFAMGGKSDIENLRLLCRHCNQRAAIKYYGVEKMNYHFERTQELKH